MSAIHQDTAAAANADAIDACNGAVFDRFVRYRHIVVAALSHRGDEAPRLI